MAGASEQNEYLQRKAASAAGIWGRVKEMPNGCWEWQGATDKGGYGAVGLHMKLQKVHRLMLELVDGPLLVDEKACHSCNNRKCCNPKHLTRGSALDNTHDAIEASGRARPRVLTLEQISEARALYAKGGWTFLSLGGKFGVSARVMGHHMRGIKRTPGTQLDPVAIEARRLYAMGGWSLRKIGAHLGRNWSVVAHMVRGVKRPDYQWKARP